MVLESEELLDLPLNMLIEKMREKEISDKNNDDDDRSKECGESIFINSSKGFIDLDVVSVDERGTDMILPKIRIFEGKNRGSKKPKENKNKHKNVMKDKDNRNNKSMQKTPTEIVKDYKNKILNWMKQK